MKMVIIFMKHNIHSIYQMAYYVQPNRWWWKCIGLLNFGLSLYWYVVSYVSPFFKFSNQSFHTRRMSYPTIPTTLTYTFLLVICVRIFIHLTRRQSNNNIALRLLFYMCCNKNWHPSVVFQVDYVFCHNEFYIINFILYSLTPSPRPPSTFPYLTQEGSSTYFFQNVMGMYHRTHKQTHTHLEITFCFC